MTQFIKKDISNPRYEFDFIFWSSKKSHLVTVFVHDTEKNYEVVASASISREEFKKLQPIFYSKELRGGD